MRLHSTTESIKEGEITWLAIAECALSTLLYITIAQHFHTFHYYALAITLAPLALLRKDAASTWVLRRYQNTSCNCGCAGYPERHLILKPIVADCPAEDAALALGIQQKPKAV